MPASAIRSRRPGVNVKLDEYTVRMGVDNVPEVIDGIDGKYKLFEYCTINAWNQEKAQLRDKTREI